MGGKLMNERDMAKWDELFRRAKGEHVGEFPRDELEAQRVKLKPVPVKAIIVSINGVPYHGEN